MKYTARQAARQPGSQAVQSVQSEQPDASCAVSQSRAVSQTEISRSDSAVSQAHASPIVSERARKRRSSSTARQPVRSSQSASAQFAASQSRAASQAARQPGRCQAASQSLDTDLPEPDHDKEPILGTNRGVNGKDRILRLNDAPKARNDFITAVAVLRTYNFFYSLTGGFLKPPSRL